MSKKKRQSSGLWRFVFLLYIALLLLLLFYREKAVINGASYTESLKQNFIWKPFYTIKNYMYVILHNPDSPYYRHCFINIVGNIVMFIPVGVLFPKSNPRARTFSRYIGSSLFFVLLVETVQLSTLRGVFDTGDIILNGIGLTLGFIIYKCFFRK